MANIVIRPKGSKGVISAFGGCEKFLKCTDPQAILYGGTGSGKTTVACLKLAGLCMKYPGVKALMTRSSYKALVNSGIESFESIVRALGWNIGKQENKPNTIYKLGESKPEEYRFPYAKRMGEKDGQPHLYEGQSRIIISSLSNARDQLGAEYDYVYVNQPEQITEDDWMFLSSRCNGRRGHAPYPQIFGDPNPEHEQHWIWLGGTGYDDYTLFPLNEKLGKGDRWTLIRSTYHDNPIIWDQKLQCLTRSGEEQIGILKKAFNPIMAKRLLDSEWCSYTGLVYGDAFIRSQHVLSMEDYAKLEIDDRWPRYWAVDYGFDEPFVCSMWAKHPDREYYVRYRLIYMSDKTILEQAETIKAATLGEPRPVLVVADRNPQETTLLSQALGINIVTAKKGPDSIKARIILLTEMLNENKIAFFEDALWETDDRLVAKKAPIGFENEVNSLRWDEKKPDMPVDGNDHEENAIGYLFLHIKASQRTVPFIWE